MPKNKLSAIDEILAKSQRLTTHFGESGQTTRHLVRGVVELSEASKQLAQSSSRDQNNIDAFRFLTQKNFDAKQLYEDVNSMVVNSEEESVQRLGMDIDSYLAQQQDLLMLGVIEDTNRAADDNVREMKQRWAADEWSGAKSQFMESLGHRAHRWEGSTRSGYEASQRPALGATHNSSPSLSSAKYNESATLSSSARAIGQLSNTPGSPLNVSSLMTRHSASTPGASSYSMAMTPGAATISESLNRLRARPHLSDLVNTHAAVVRSLQLLSHGKSNKLVAPCSQLAESINIPAHVAAKAVVSDGLTKADLTAYKSLLEFLASMVGEGGDNITPGQFSSVCFNKNELFAAGQEDCRRTLTCGAKQFLEGQIWEIWSRAVDAAVHNGDLAVLPSAEGTSRQQRLRSYVSFQYRIGAIPRECGAVMSPPSTQQQNATTINVIRRGIAPDAASQHGDTPLWAYIYHCLRVGDLSGAANELAKCVSSGFREGEAIALSSVKALIAVQQGETRPSQQDLSAFRESMTQCKALYASEQQQQSEGEQAGDPFRAVVFNLLGLADRDGLANCPLPGFSLEDFLWANLWFIHVTRLGGAQTNTGETDLLELILEYGGADYFDADRSAPFKYATVLFCCQRFGDAIAHLWACNKSLAAVHLLEICLHYGLVLPHQGLSQNPAHGQVNSLLSSAGAVDHTPSTLLQLYFNSSVFQHYPEVVADYLVAADSNWLSCAQGLDSELQEVHRLRSQAAVGAILQTFVSSLDKEALTAVVGEPADDARGAPRTPGRLDDYLQQDQVALLLAKAAFSLLTQNREAERAIYLYHLAGRYSDVLDEMCNQLSAVLVPASVSFGQAATPKQQYQQLQYTSAQAAAREHWRTVGEEFVNKYLTQRGSSQSAVMHQLSQQGATELADALTTLVGLFGAVDAYVRGDFESALSALDAANVLPSSEDSFAAVRPHVRRVVDDIVLIALESAKGLHQQLRAARHTSGGGMPFGSPQASSTSLGLTTDRDIRMQGLQTRARALVAFVNRIKPRLARPDTVHLAARIEATFL